MSACWPPRNDQKLARLTALTSAHKASSGNCTTQNAGCRGLPRVKGAAQSFTMASTLNGSLESKARLPNLTRFVLPLPAASSFSFCRPAVEYRALPEDFKHQLSRRTGGNLTWHDGRGQKTAGGRTVKLLQQPGTEGLQVPSSYTTSAFHTKSNPQIKQKHQNMQLSRNTVPVL